MVCEVQKNRCLHAVTRLSTVLVQKKGNSTYKESHLDIPQSGSSLLGLPGWTGRPGNREFGFICTS